MEIKAITKTDKDGKRLFIELSKKMREGGDLPDLKKGDEVLLLPRRKLSPKQMEKIVGKYIKFFEISDADSFALCFEGVLKKNDPSYWEEDEKDMAEAKFVLIDPEIGAIDAFDDLDDAFDLQVLPGQEKFVNKINCSKCKKQFLEGYKYCPHCGKFNKSYQKEE